MSAPTLVEPTRADRPDRRKVVAWAAWDWGSAAFNAVITTFVFTRWLTSDAFVDRAIVDAAEGHSSGPAADALDSVLAQHSAWLGWGLAIAGFFIAVLAPAMGAQSDAAGRRRRWLGIYTAATVTFSALMVFVAPRPGSLTFNVLLGVTLLAFGNVVFELASVNYNAMLSQVATPSTLGRISGIGWGAGYLGGIVLLLVLLVAFLSDGGGVFGVSTDGDLNIRLAVLAAAVWNAGFAIPVLVVVPEAPATRAEPFRFVEAYRRVGRDLARLWRDDRPVLSYLIASAVYRDGLAGVFTFGAVIGSVTFGLSASEIITFAIEANVVAGVATLGAGFLDDRLGSRRIILASLVGLVVTSGLMFAMHDGGKGVFTVLALILSAFVGPAQSASRALLSHITPPGREAESFGLYAMTGRAASFLAPAAFSAMIAIFGSQYWGILGISAVLAVGLVGFWMIRFPDALTSRKLDA